MKERITKVRTDAGLSQAEFAETIGISRTAVQALEYGRNNPSKTTLRVIANAFNVNYDWLKDGIGEMYCTPETVGKASTLTGRYAEAYNTDSTFRALVDAYIALDNTERKIFQQALEKFAEAVVDAKERGAEPPTVSDIAVQMHETGLLTRLDDADGQ